MKVNCYPDSTLAEDHVDIYCRDKNRKIEGIIRYINANMVIIGRDDEMTASILPNEIFYCETVDRKCYAYLEHEVYRIDFSLAGFMEQFSSNGFVQISKSVAVNVYHIKQFKTDLNMKMILYMENGEAVILNRAYKKNFMERLKQLQEGVL